MSRTRHDAAVTRGPGQADRGDPDDPLAGSAVTTRRGDDGSTGLLFGGSRIAKDDPRAEAYGTVDEAVAAFGLARAELLARTALGTLPPALVGMADLVLRLQRELFVAGAELAANPDAWDRMRDGETRISIEMLDALDATLADVERRVRMPHEFVVPGETRISAALELARTILRRAERRAVALEHAGLIPGEYLLAYLNRLSDLAWVLARAAEQAERRPSRPSRPG